MRNKWFKKGAALAFALLLWEIAALLIDQPLLLCTPVEAAGQLVALLGQGEFYRAVGFSTVRIAGGFLIAFTLALPLAFLSHRHEWVKLMLWPFVACARSVPVASFIVLCMMWLTARTLSVFISALMVFPILYANLLSGLDSVDRPMREMAKTFRFSRFRELMYIELPHLRPFILSASGTALGMAFKSGIAAEVIGLPTGSVGEKIYMAKVYFSTADLLAWTAAIVIVSRLLEKLFLTGINAAFDAWERR